MPVTMYGVTKVCSERLGEYYHRRYDVDFRAVRFLSILGPGRVAGSGWSAYTSLVIEECAKGNPYVLKVSRDLRLRFIYVKDAALSLIRLGDAAASSLTTRCYNLDGFSASTEEIVDAVRRHVPGARISYEFDADYQRVMDTQYGNIQRRMDDSLACRDWGWQASYTLDEAVRDFVETRAAGAHVVREGGIMRFAGKKVLVTGGGRGIGQAIALAFAREGASVAVNAAHMATAEETATQAREFKVKAIAIEASVTDEEQVKSMVDRVVRDLGGLDVLVNNAGISQPIMPLLEQSTADWDRVMATNLRGTYVCSKAAARSG